MALLPSASESVGDPGPAGRDSAAKLQSSHTRAAGVGRRNGKSVLNADSASVKESENPGGG